MIQFPPTRVPPFRDEQRWGNTHSAIFTGGSDIHSSGQLISVNEVPARAWDMMLVLEGISNLHIDSEVFAEFKITIGVGSSTATFLRILTESRALVPPNDKTGVIELLVMPAASFIVEITLTIDAAGAQPFPVKTKCGVFAAPRGMPFLASLESEALVLE